MSETQEPKRRRKNKRLIELLDRRNLKINSLGAMCYCGRASVSEILAGRRRGTPTWNKLKKILNAEELECAMAFANEVLGQNEGRLILQDGVVKFVKNEAG